MRLIRAASVLFVFGLPIALGAFAPELDTARARTDRRADFETEELEMNRSIQMTSQDRKRLEFIEYMTGSQDRRDLAGLASELERAIVVAPDQIPPDVVTMRSRVRLLDLDDGWTHEYTLVYPDEADLAAGKISIVAPIAAAVIGCREGDEVEWEAPGGRRRIRVEAVLYQPEAAGDIHL